MQEAINNTVQSLSGVITCLKTFGCTTSSNCFSVFCSSAHPTCTCYRMKAIEVWEWHAEATPGEAGTQNGTHPSGESWPWMCIASWLSPEEQGDRTGNGKFGRAWVSSWWGLARFDSLFCLQGWERQTGAGRTRHTGHSWNAIQMSQGYVLPLVKWGFRLGSGYHTLISHSQWDFWVSLISAWQRNS